MDSYKQKIIKDTDEKILREFSGEGSGHDYYHIDRVRRTAMLLAEKTADIDLFVVEMGALLHDIADHKFHNGDDSVGPRVAKEFLSHYKMELKTVDKIIDIVKEISFKGLGVSTKMSSREGEIVQDADRLDAIGAIGIARTFAYGGSKNRPIYDPNIKPVCHTSAAAYKASTAPTINHFYEKLLHLKDKMITDAAKELAEERHKFMEDFLKQFYQEWG